MTLDPSTTSEVREDKESKSFCISTYPVEAFLSTTKFTKIIRGTTTVKARPTLQSRINEKINEPNKINGALIISLTNKSTPLSS